MSQDAHVSANNDAPAPTQEPGSVLQKLPLHIIESAGFVAFVTAILYFMGYSYYAGFFERISLPPPYPELSTSDYFLQAFSSLTGLLVAALLSIPYRTTVPTTIAQAFWVNSAFIIVPLILVQDARTSGFLVQELALFLGAVAYGFGIFLFLGVYFRLEGAADATRLIEGRLHPSASIVVQTHDAASPVNGTRLLVALARDGDFYLVQQASPAPDAPLVIYVPASEVRTATMQRVGASLAAPTPEDQHP